MVGLLWRIECVHALLLCVVAAMAAWAGGATTVQSVLLGGALIWGSVWVFRQAFAFLVRRRPTHQRLAIALLFAKLPVFWAVFWLITRTRLITLDGAGLAAGITCFPAAAVIVALAWRAGTDG
jgi:hypothetical protein